jgi:hypothetical protein
MVDDPWDVLHLALKRRRSLCPVYNLTLSVVFEVYFGLPDDHDTSSSVVVSNLSYIVFVHGPRTYCCSLITFTIGY